MNSLNNYVHVLKIECCFDYIFVAINIILNKIGRKNGKYRH